MTKFLTTSGCIHNIEQIISKATDSVTLVTPYLRLSKNMLERIADAEKANIKITVLYGKVELDKQEQKQLYEFGNVCVYFYKDLHAKCYYNENTMVLSSMNLHEYSEKNNREMGILIEKQTNQSVFSDAVKEIQSILNASVLEKPFKEDKIILSIDKHLIRDEKYLFENNFHLPSLFSFFTESYPNANIVLADRLTLFNYPIKGISIEFSQRIVIRFENQETYEKFKVKKRRTFETLLQKKRIFWNHNQISIYLATNYVAKTSNEGLKDIVEKFLEITEKANTEFIA